MLSLFPSPNKRARRNAQVWLQTAERVRNYQRDLMTPKESGELADRTRRLWDDLRKRGDTDTLNRGIDALQEVVRRIGGTVYPQSSLAENVEFFIFAAFIFIGVRSYAVGMFEIPTNSMWPTYNGMTPEVFIHSSDEPGLASEAARIVAEGARPHRLDAPADGEVLVPIGGRASLGYVHCVPVDGRTWVVFPSKQRDYTFPVGDRSVSVRVPLDFDMDWAVYSDFFGDHGSYSHPNFASALRDKLRNGEFVDRLIDGEVLHCVRTGRYVKAGERAFAFDVMAGDMMAVDRLSYNFVRPKVGSGFVFRTGRIPEIMSTKGDIYLVKRLVGVPGDILEVGGTTLYRNGLPITGSPAFEANAQKQGRYPGYEAMGLLAPGRTVRVGPDQFFAMGDNSPDSEDGRYWGFVQAKEATGRPLFVYYPLGSHWGVAR